MVDLTPANLNFYLHEVDAGYSEYAYPAIAIIAQYLEQGKELPDRAKSYLITALKDISQKPEGKKRISPAKALKLTGKKKSKTWKTNYELAQLIHEAINEGAGVNEAAEWYAKNNKPNHSKEKILAAYYEYKDALENPSPQ